MVNHSGKSIKIDSKERNLRPQLDFLDLGGGAGGSFKFIKKRFQVDRGLSVDIQKRKVDQAISNGIPAIQLDATDLSIFRDNSFRFVSMVHILEHLPSKDLALSIITEATRVASSFIFIRGPMFYTEYLSNLGLKFYWSSWKGHTLMIEPDEILRLTDPSKVKNCDIKYLGKINDSNNECIHPLDASSNRHNYDHLIDPPKRSNIIFDKPIHREFELLIRLNKACAS